MSKRRKMTKPLVNGVPAEWPDAVIAYIDGELVDWNGTMPPTNQSILSVIHERQKRNSKEKARAIIKERGNLTDKEMDALIGFAKAHIEVIQQRLYTTDYLNGFRQGLTHAFGGGKVIVIEKLVQPYLKLIGESSQ